MVRCSGVRKAECKEPCGWTVGKGCKRTDVEVKKSTSANLNIYQPLTVKISMRVQLCDSKEVEIKPVSDKQVEMMRNYVSKNAEKISKKIFSEIKGHLNENPKTQVLGTKCNFNSLKATLAGSGSVVKIDLVLEGSLSKALTAQEKKNLQTYMTLCSSEVFKTKFENKVYWIKLFSS